MYSFIGSALPLVMARKSASASSSVQSALPTAPAWTLPLPFFTSMVHALSGLVSLNTKVLPTRPTMSALRAM